jgi:Acyl-ACP thioesterase
MTLDKTLTPVLDGHPDVFDREWPLRVADIDPGGRLRLDAAARHIQDIGQDQMKIDEFIGLSYVSRGRVAAWPHIRCPHRTVSRSWSLHRASTSSGEPVTRVAFRS